MQVFGTEVDTTLFFTDRHPTGICFLQCRPCTSQVFTILSASQVFSFVAYCPSPARYILSPLA